MSYWIKLSLEILDDPKMARLTDFQFRIFTLCLLYAKELDKGGDLAPAGDIAWRFRLPEKAVVDALLAMERAGIIAENDGRYLIVNFAKRQALSDGAERTRRYRERLNEKTKNTQDASNVTSRVTSHDSYSDSCSSSSSLSDSVSVFEREAELPY